MLKCCKGETRKIGEVLEWREISKNHAVGTRPRLRYLQNSLVRLFKKEQVNQSTQEILSYGSSHYFHQSKLRRYRSDISNLGRFIYTKDFGEITNSHRKSLRK